MERRNQVFQILKPPCVRLSQAALGLAGKSPNSKAVVASLNELLKTLQQVSGTPEALDEKLADYVFFPLSHVLRESQKLPIRALELSLQCLSILLRTGWRSQIAPNLGGQLLILLTFLASPSSAEQKISATSEELQSASFECLSGLFFSLSATTVGRESLITLANIPSLGHAVTIILEGIMDGPSNEVQLSALKALEAVCSAVKDRDVLANFLPGIVSAITKVLTPSTKSRRFVRLLEGGLDLLSLLFQVVLCDEQTKTLRSSSSMSSEPLESGKVLTSSWLKATAGQIKIALANILKLRQHERIEVRQALLRFCIKIIQECRTSLSGSVSMLLETVVSLSGADNEDDIERALKQITVADPTLIDLLRSSLHGWVISLPRLMRSSDDKAKHKIIHQVSVAFRLLNDQGVDLTIVDRVIASSLRDSITNVLTDSKGVGSVISSTPTNALVESRGWLQDGRSTSFQSLIMSSRTQEDTVEELKLLLEQLAVSDSSLMVARDLVDSIRSNRAEPQLASFWLSLNLLQFNIKHNVELEDFLDFGSSQLGVQTELLEELYSFSLSILTNSDSDSDSDWRFHALALETVALQATQEKADFRIELVDALYPVIHLVGSSNSALRNHAITCLNVISDACGYSETSGMIVSNVDYLVNAVALKMNTFDISPQAPQVLLMMIRLSGPSLLPYLDDLIESIFASLEYFHGYPKLVELLFSVLKGIAEEGVKSPQLAIAAGEDHLHHKSPWKLATITEVADSIKKLKADAVMTDEEKAERFAEAFPHRPWKEPDEEEQDSEINPKEPEDDRPSEAPELPPPAPKTFNLLLKISQLTQHYLTSSSPSLRTSLLSLLNTTFPTLAKHENSFLPLINTLWPVLLPRLDDPEAYVVSSALDVIGIMSTHAGDFMKGRIEGTWEDLKTIHRRALHSKNQPAAYYGREPLTQIASQRSRDPGPIVFSLSQIVAQPQSQEYYVDAPTRMIWESLVRLLMVIVEYVAVSDEIFDDILDMLDPILDERGDVRTALENRNSDAVWLRDLKKQTLTMRKEGNKNLSAFKIPKPIGRPEWHFAEIQVR
ncbi:HEAT repeat protein-like protein [Lepidopterella palustris CBS 459.81]|uniref:HEAT repeat protein-like protein n=1 Tax=Lepidopterella palustris CBS 459.81 TaxID=1314670 RepID=A0A8E2EEY2_9PEZI|nr:HEAT repeat protein-like protein [Lepidopterella palustris CBS 459.81]